MVIRWLAVAALFSSVSAWASLEAGRAALKADDLAGALKGYKDIGVKDKQWPDKVEDLTRYMLIKENGTEAWRMLQVAHRVNRFPEAWGDYERLAMYRANACPLSLPAYNQVHGHLLNAAVYRYMEQMFESDTAPLPSSDAISVHLATGLTPYLQDIPDVELAPMRGCRLAKFETRKKDSVMGAELSELQDSLAGGVGDTSAKILVTMRAIELADTLKKDKLKKKLLDSLPPTVLIPWKELPDPEKQWLFAKVFGGQRLDQIPETKRAKAQEIALQAIYTDKSSPYWLAFIDLNSLSLNERVKVLMRADQLGEFKGKSWTLYELARNLFSAKRTTEGLTILRRLLVEGEGTADPAIEEACVHLAARIFSQYRFEPGLQGALQSSLPSRLWNDLLAESTVRAAVMGRSVEFERLQTLLKERQRGYRTETPETALNRALAKRQLGLFVKKLQDFKYSSGKLVEYTRTFAADVMSEDSPGDLEQALKPYSRELVKRLRALTTPGSEIEDQVNELASLLDGGAWAKGAQGVRQGVIKVGVARWAVADLRPVDFMLHPPTVLPRRELIYVPVADQRTWQFSTVMR